MSKTYKLLAMAALAVMLGGCSYESPDIEQTTPDVAYRHAHNILIDGHVRSHLQTIQTILVAEQWAALSSDSVRYAFEDAHLPAYKIRRRDANIELVSTNGSTQTITRDLLPITQIGATRTLNKLTLRTVGANTYKVEYSTPDSSPDKLYNNRYNSEPIENISWTVRYKHDFSRTTELLNIVEGSGSYCKQGLTQEYIVSDMMCEVRHRVGVYLSIFNGELRIRSHSLVMDAEGTPPDIFTINYTSTDGITLTY